MACGHANPTPISKNNPQLPQGSGQRPGAWAGLGLYRTASSLSKETYSYLKPCTDSRFALQPERLSAVAWFLIQPFPGCWFVWTPAQRSSCLRLCSATTRHAQRWAEWLQSLRDFSQQSRGDCLRLPSSLRYDTARATLNWTIAIPLRFPPANSTRHCAGLVRAKSAWLLARRLCQCGKSEIPTGF